MLFLEHPRFGKLVKFLLGGIINTSFSYVLYLSLRNIMPYQWAYFLAYIAGILFAYWYNSTFVFRVSLSFQGLMAYPIVYLVQYVISALVLNRLVVALDVSEVLAPLLVAAAMLPVTFVLSKFFITRLAK